MEQRTPVLSKKIFLIALILFVLLFKSTKGKSGGGHYSSQRSLGGTHGQSSGNQGPNSMSWISSWPGYDANGWYDPSKSTAKSNNGSK